MRGGIAAWLALAAFAALGAPACGDELSLDVVVTHPPDAAVARTVVSIYESNTTACKQLELGDLSTAELAAILVAEEPIEGTGGAGLDGISRVDRKLVAARGYDAMGRFLTAGCAEHEVITGRDTVTVATAFAATLSIGALSADQSGIPITLTDAEGRSLPGHPVTWRVYGPDGAEPAATAAPLVVGTDASWELGAATCTSAAGTARLHPVPPSTIAGYAVDIRPSWPSQPNALLTSFARIDPTLTAIEPNPDVTRPCAVRVAGATRRLVCLQLGGVAGAAIAREYEVTVAGGNARLQQRATAPVDPDVRAVFAVPRGADRDVYAVTSDAQVIGLFGPSVPPDPSPHLSGAVVTDALLIPACDAGQEPELVLRTASLSAKKLQRMPPLGGTVTDFHGVTAELLLPLTLRTAGCVTELRPNSDQPLRRPGIVYDLGQRLGQGEQRISSTLAFACDLADAAKCRVGLPIAGTGAGLSAPSATEEPRLTGMTLDASGVNMSSWALLPAPGGEFLLVERGRVPSASIPNLVISGRFDGDARSDLFWDLPSLTQPATSFQATYGRMIGDTRLSALSPFQPIVVDDLVAGDLTGDDLDDVVIAGHARREDDAGNVITTHGLVVVPMNVPAPNPDTVVDQPCP